GRRRAPPSLRSRRRGRSGGEAAADGPAGMAEAADRMKLVMTLRTRDEADVVDAQIAFHLNAGVDFVVATDHRSQDGTVEILESYAREGHLHLICEEGDEMDDGGWATRMSRVAA